MVTLSRFILFISCLIFSFSIMSQSPERIFYCSFRPEGWDIYRSTDEGKSFSVIAAHPALDYDAVITPDGKWIVFTSEREGHPGLFIVPLGNDAPVRRLIRSNSMQDQVNFSPDGKWMVFVSTHEGNAEIYRIPFQPDSLLPIERAVNLTRHPGGDFRPAYSPDGSHIAYCSDRVRPIVPHPVFSFARQRSGDIFIMDTSGNHVKQLTDSSAWDGSPSWSADGKCIYYYSGQDQFFSIYKMNTDGTSHMLVLDKKIPAVSPVLLPGGELAFTSWTESGQFKLMTYYPSTDSLKALYTADLDMLNLNTHPNGSMVFHGGAKPTTQEYNKGGFEGELLVNRNDTISEMGKPIEFYGVRRAFTAPPDPAGPYLMFNVNNAEGSEVFTPWLYVLLCFPVFGLILFFTGIIKGIRDRKVIPFWRHAFFSAIVLLVMAIVLGLLFYLTVIQILPVVFIRLGMAILLILSAGIFWFFYRKWKNNTPGQGVDLSLSKWYALLFGAAVLSTAYAGIFINHFLNTSSGFYKVNYLTNSITPVFEFQKEAATNPINSQILDSKITADGSQYIFTVGNFRGDATNQGDVWSYRFDTKKISKLTDSPYNDGFADFSADGQKMVFRSGRNGNFNILLQEQGNLVNISQTDSRENFPSISAQGDKIVFSSDKEGTGSPVKTMDLYLSILGEQNKWSEPVKLTASKGQNAHAHFSPDGEWVIYTTEEYGINDEQPLIQPYIFSPQMYGEITLINLRTNEKIRLTHNKWEEGAPVWVKGY